MAVSKHLRSSDSFPEVIKFMQDFIVSEKCEKNTVPNLYSPGANTVGRKCKVSSLQKGTKPFPRTTICVVKKKIELADR